MAEERICCISPGCENTILPATVQRIGGYCGPCDGKRKLAKHQEFIRENRRDVNLFSGIIDSVEIIRLIHQPRRPDPLIRYTPPPKSIEELYCALSEAQAENLMSFAAQSLRHGDKAVAENVARYLAAFTDYNLDPMLETWIALNKYWPPLAFRSAGSNIRDHILDVLHNKRDINANHALQAIAWIGDEVVVKAFEAFDFVPPPWAAKLHISPSDYARTAGWELTNGKRRELTFTPCFSILPAPSNAQQVGVNISQETQDHCLWCGRQLINLLHIETSAAPFSLFKFAGECLEIRTCDQCTCFGFVFAELDAQGHGHWAPQNIRPKFLPDDPATWRRNPWSGIPVQLAHRRPFYADIFLPATMTQIGGLPAWVQDLAYPNCSKCGKTMLFFAQIDSGHFPGHEGVYYAFLCESCRTTATTYQQT